MNKLELRPALAQPSAVVPPSHSARRTFVRPDHLALGAIATRGWMFRPHPYLSELLRFVLAIVVLTGRLPPGLRRAWPSLFHHHRQGPPSDSSDDSISLFVVFDDQPSCEASQKRCEP